MESPFKEIWLGSSGGPLMCAIINGELRRLMYLREKGDSGFSSRDPSYDGPADAQIEYELNNGQTDCFPAAWTLPMDVVRRALEYCERERRRPPFVEWHEDGMELARRSLFVYATC